MISFSSFSVLHWKHNGDQSRQLPSAGTVRSPANGDWAASGPWFGRFYLQTSFPFPLSLSSIISKKDGEWYLRHQPFGGLTRLQVSALTETTNNSCYYYYCVDCEVFSWGSFIKRILCILDFAEIEGPLINFFLIFSWYDAITVFLHHFPHISHGFHLPKWEVSLQLSSTRIC